MSGTGSFHQPHGRERRRAALELLHELRDQQGFCALIAQDVDLEGATSHHVQRTGNRIHDPADLEYDTFQLAIRVHASRESTSALRRS